MALKFFSGFPVMVQSKPRLFDFESYLIIIQSMIYGEDKLVILYIQVGL